uniref:Uncharacterized protein n=1 Tax=Rhizochromulina marina TaxID=1034831 RepID=A0A7S2SCY8_9STRA|mmetsp:Transcript_28415/g.83038  ORF Transcript_28415/g.83038 Transcript_28415/m.83038 type:complete len:442 (+) Transcript_28415:85-1410(+)
MWWGAPTTVATTTVAAASVAAAVGVVLVWLALQRLRGSKESQRSPSDGDAGELGTYPFSEKHHWALRNNPMVGVTFDKWLRISWRFRREIQWLKYWPRMFLITCLSILNSLLAIVEFFLYSRPIHRVTLNPRPVFIIGPSRSGTSLLHRLLSMDERQFAFCSMFCAMFPSSFLWFERMGKVALRWVVGKTWPTDKHMHVSFDSPHEDEIGTNLLTGGVSPVMSMWFMPQEENFRGFHSFGDASDEDTRSWIDSFLFLLRKLSLRAGSVSKRLLLKSHFHTARVKLLLRLFPEAQFIYIHRNPYDVFKSAAHTADTQNWYTYLATPTNNQIQEAILRQYEIHWSCYEEARSGSSESPPVLTMQNTLEISYNDLTRDPVGTIGTVYEHFGWLGWGDMKQRIERESLSVKHYRANQHDELSPALKGIVRERWGSSFERLGYSKD